jgi:hypothetical protein
MAYKFRTSTSFGRARRYLSQCIGGVEARPQTAHLSPPLKALRDEFVAQRAARESVDDLVLVTTARLRVEDVDWDNALGQVSSKSYLLSNKDADSDPYATLFGKVDAKRARGFGAAKAVIVGETVVRDGRRLDADLEAELNQLEVATNRLSEAKRLFDEADDALFVPRQSKKKLINKLNDLIAVTEAGILTAFPGRDDIVSAILTPWFARRYGKSSADSGEPEIPDLDDEGDEADDDADIAVGGG